MQYRTMPSHVNTIPFYVNTNIPTYIYQYHTSTNVLMPIYQYTNTNTPIPIYHNIPYLTIPYHIIPYTASSSFYRLILDTGETATSCYVHYTIPLFIPLFYFHFPFLLLFFQDLASTTTSNESSGIGPRTGSCEKHEQAIQRTGSTATGTLSV